MTPEDVFRERLAMYQRGEFDHDWKTGSLVSENERQRLNEQHDRENRSNAWLRIALEADVTTAEGDM